jgi:hypothetical protein
VSLIALRDAAAPLALAQVGVREHGGRNRGDQVEEYLAAVDLPPGESWCCAGIVWCYREATIRCGGGLQLPLPRTGKCAYLWARVPDLWKSDHPTVNAIYIHLEDPEDPKSPGHCGIVTSFSERTLEGVEFNTNAVGSRNGDRVRINLRRLSYVNAGFIDIGRLGPVDLPATS